MNKNIFVGLLTVVVIGLGVYILIQHNGSQSTVVPDQTMNIPQNSSSGSSSTQTTNPQTPIAQSGTTSGGTSPNPISVAGMQKYTDTNLGYSFWYPTGWTLNTNASGGISALSGGTITKTLAVGPTNDMAEGITIQDFVSNGLSITDSSNCGPVDGCYAVRYYFNPTVHEWMKETYPTMSSGTTSVADISANTMGGLHVFAGNARFGNDVIIPLSANHFVVVSGTSAGGIAERYLANTIVASDPSVATPVSTAQQIQTIQAEMNAYGSNQQSNGGSSSVTWQSYTDPATGISLQYPSLNGTSLKPAIVITPAANIDTQGCLPQQNENGTIATETVTTINHRQFCHSESTDSGMGHYYDTYYYTFLHNGIYYTLTYDASTINCGGYGGVGDPGYQTCETNNTSISSLIQYIQQSLSTLVL